MPEDHARWTADLIAAGEAGTLPGLFRRRCERTPEREAYRQFEAGAWRSYSWQQAAALAARWQLALAGERLSPGDRVAVLLRNSVEWVCFDQAAQSLGLVVVPLYTIDHPDNIAYILADSGARLLLVGRAEQWLALAPRCAALPELRRVLCVEPAAVRLPDLRIRVSFIGDWLPFEAPAQPNLARDPHALATIVYTSGTTGPPKGVMLSHRNILWDAEAVLKQVPGYLEDMFLSFLPLSHAFERTVGYYLPVMAGCTVVYARSIEALAEDIATVRPTVLVSVPRVYERVYARLQRQLRDKGPLARALFRWTEQIGWNRFQAAQHRAEQPGTLSTLMWPVLRRLVADKLLARFGGRLRLAVTGGAPLSASLSRCFLGLGLPVLQGYGLTEAAPVVTGNLLADNVPDSVGVPLPGLEVKLGDKDELLVRGPNVMLGYWNRPEETAAAIDPQGWLRTGDQARIEDGYVFIAGRLKEIIVMSTGEKAAPADVEMALTEDPLFEQAMVVGEGKPYLAALLVLNPDAWRALAEAWSLAPEDDASLADSRLKHRVEEKCRERLRSFPRHAEVRKFWLTLEPWTIENGLITPTMKLKRAALEQRFAPQIRALYAGHEVPA
jgi:long-chain acyl-CoA synthetase